MRTRHIFMAALLALSSLGAQAGEVMLRAKGGGANTCLMANGGDSRAEACNPNDSRQRFEVVDPSVFSAPKPPVVLPTDPPASTPSTPPKTDPPKTDPAPSTGDIPFFSVNWPAGFSGSNPHWGPYPTKAVNGILCLNNIWGFSGSLSSARQSLGCQPASNGGVDIRFAIKAPGKAGGEVASYPSAIVGQTPSGSPASPSTALPRRMTDVSSAVITYQSAGGDLTRGQRTTDVWFTTTGGCRSSGCRRIEFMYQYKPHGGYNAPAPWSKGGPGRVAPNLGDGPNERASYERLTIGGEVVDVYSYEPGTWGGSWRLIKVFPLVFPTGASRVDVKEYADYFTRKGWMNPGDYLGAIEVGWEPVIDKGAITGDAWIRGLKIEVQ